MSDRDVTPIHVLPRFPRRAADGHKGSYGKVLVVAGSRGMTGAAILCGRGALRAGAGLVQVACPVGVQPVVAAGCPCYTTFGIRQHVDGAFGDGAAADVAEWGRAADVLAIGPGLGHAPDAVALVQDVVYELPRTPTVIDADGLNALAPFTGAFKDRPVPLILTPHPGEFSRLSGVAVHEIQARREAAAADFAARFGVVLLLKGSGTIVTDGRRVYRNSTGNPGMATGGTGDVLTGVIAALLGQHLSPFDAAVLGAWAHGKAGDLAAADLGRTGLTAADLPEYLPYVFRELEAGP
ncbi:MAG: nnr 2 [Gemmataceae bacterium]|nr:nnr 2 [Gemmataceae bacterium]